MLSVVSAKPFFLAVRTNEVSPTLHATLLVEPSQPAPVCSCSVSDALVVTLMLARRCFQFNLRPKAL
ncbi:MAG: hypothetical protein J7641_09610 [Cyanobacteria bacterium SID2]|nr:hypothetical protein [Cyanobacteria bacterium SID2]MBP0002183.1 hypothetical protein [Cyanobacteria bacterium SBC]